MLRRLRVLHCREGKRACGQRRRAPAWPRLLLLALVAALVAGAHRATTMANETLMQLVHKLITRLNSVLLPCPSRQFDCAAKGIADAWVRES